MRFTAVLRGGVLERPPRVHEKSLLNTQSTEQNSRKSDCPWLPACASFFSSRVCLAFAAVNTSCSTGDTAIKIDLDWVSNALQGLQKKKTNDVSALLAQIHQLAPTNSSDSL